MKKLNKLSYKKYLGIVLLIFVTGCKEKVLISSETITNRQVVEQKGSGLEKALRSATEGCAYMYYPTLCKDFKVIKFQVVGTAPNLFGGNSVFVDVEYSYTRESWEYR